MARPGHDRGDLREHARVQPGFGRGELEGEIRVQPGQDFLERLEGDRRARMALGQVLVPVPPAAHELAVVALVWIRWFAMARMIAASLPGRGDSQ